MAFWRTSRGGTRPAPPVASSTTARQRRPFRLALAIAVVGSGLAVAAVPASANDFRPCGRYSAPGTLGLAAGEAGRSAAPRGHQIPWLSHPAGTRAGAGWPRFHYDAVSSGLNVAERTLNYLNVPKLVRKWRGATGGPVESSPTISNGVVYVGSDDGRVHAFAEATGNAVWSYDT